MVGEQKRKIRWAISSLITVCLFSIPAYAKYSGGTGDPNDAAESMYTVKICLFMAKSRIDTDN